MPKALLDEGKVSSKNILLFLTVFETMCLYQVDLILMDKKGEKNPQKVKSPKEECIISNFTGLIPLFFQFNSKKTFLTQSENISLGFVVVIFFWGGGEMSGRFFSSFGRARNFLYQLL